MRMCVRKTKPSLKNISRFLPAASTRVIATTPALIERMDEAVRGSNFVTTAPASARSRTRAALRMVSPSGMDAARAADEARLGQERHQRIIDREMPVDFRDQQ